MADFVPNRIDRDPAVILGVTSPEIKAIFTVSVISSLFLALIIGVIASSVVIGFLAVLFITTGLSFSGVFVLAAYKRNKPPHFVTHRWHILLSHLIPAPFIHESQRYRSTR